MSGRQLFTVGLSLAGAAAVCAWIGCGSGSGNHAGAGDAGGNGDTSSGGSGSGSSGGGSGSGGSSSSGSSTGCSAYPNAAFCDDFENETDASFATNWPGTPYDNPEFLRPVVITSPTAYSPTHVLHESAQFIADAGNAGQRFSQVGRNLPTLLPTQSVSVGFSVRIVSFTDVEGGYESGPSPNFQVQFYPVGSSAGPGCLVEFQGADPTHYYVNMCGQPGPGGSPTTTVAFAVGTWQRISVSATFGPTDAGTGTVTLAIDGAPVESVPMSGQPGTGVISYTGTLALGAFGYDQTPSMTLDLDDVVIEQM